MTLLEAHARTVGKQSFLLLKLHLQISKLVTYSSDSLLIPSILHIDNGNACCLCTKRKTNKIYNLSSSLEILLNHDELLQDRSK